MKTTTAVPNKNHCTVIIELCGLLFAFALGLGVGVMVDPCSENALASPNHISQNGTFVHRNIVRVDILWLEIIYALVMRCHVITTRPANTVNGHNV